MKCGKIKIMEPLSQLEALPEPSPANLYPPCRHAGFFSYGQAHAFEPGSQAFSLVNAAWLADASLLAYDPDTAFVEGVLGPAGFEDVRAVEGRSSRVMIAANDAAIVIAFRGTQVFWPGRPAEMSAVVADWFTDARTGLVASGQGGEVHEGFKAALDQVWRPLSEIVGTLRAERPSRTLWVTGHSLGAALATLAASRWAGMVSGLYTFGSPLVGDGAFQQEFRVPCHRFVHQTDLITEVPLFGLRLCLPSGWARYAHVGTRHWIDAMGGIHSGGVGPVLPSRDPLARFTEKLAALSLQHHAPLYYALRLRQNLELKRSQTG